MAPIVHPGHLLKRELTARKLSANRLALDIGVPSGRITHILNGRRTITADTAVRLGRYFGNRAQFWLELQSQHDIGMVEREKGAEITRRVMPPELSERIEVNPDIMGGKPVIRGTRISIALVLRKLDAGLTTEAIIADYPRLTQEDIRAALAFAAGYLR